MCEVNKKLSPSPNVGHHWYERNNPTELTTSNKTILLTGPPPPAPSSHCHLFSKISAGNVISTFLRPGPHSLQTQARYWWCMDNSIIELLQKVHVPIYYFKLTDHKFNCCHWEHKSLMQARVHERPGRARRCEMLWSETDDRRAAEMALNDISSTSSDTDTLASHTMSHTSCGQSSRTSAHYKEKSTSVIWRQKTVISGHRSFFEHKLMLSSQISKVGVILNTTWEQCL